jgi:hypothetical protein
MTVAVNQPFISLHDSNGLPIVGGKVYVYLFGTTTLANIYSDAALSVTLDNPLVSDASGDCPRAYIAPGTYKLRAETSAAVLIWQYDNIDTNLGTGGVLGIASGGTSATSAAAARTALGAAAQTDVDDLSADFTTLSASFQSVVSAPQGRLTLTEATPVLAADVTAAATVFYVPWIGNQCPIWDGTQYNFKVFGTMTLALVASHVANAIYDVFMFLDGSTTTIGSGPAWNTATSLLGDRGTGAGTTELERKLGLWTNKVSMTARNGSTTYTVDANKGTYVGSIFMDGTNAQISCHVSVGTARKCGVSNAYNRVPIELLMRDATASWTYATNAVRQSRGTAANIVTVFSGLPEEIIDVDFRQTVGSTANASTGDVNIGIGWGVTNAFIAGGRAGFLRVSQTAATAVETRSDLCAYYSSPPLIGIVNVAGCENVPTAATTTATFYGGEQMLMSARWRA